MLASLNVVSIAVVCCDRTRRSAMRARNRLIGTRCSRCSLAAATLTAAGGGRWVTGTDAIFGASFAATFDSGIGSASLDAFDASGSSAGTAVLAPALAPVSMVAMTSPLVTALPSTLTILTNTPDSGAGVSSTTLSVSISTRFSSRLTYSLTFLCHDTSVASDTDSDNCGTLTSISMLPPPRTNRRHATRRQSSARNSPAHAVACYTTICSREPAMPKNRVPRKSVSAAAACAAASSAECGATRPDCAVLPGTTRLQPRYGNARSSLQNRRAETDKAGQCALTASS